MKFEYILNSQLSTFDSWDNFVELQQDKCGRVHCEFDWQDSGGSTICEIEYKFFESEGHSCRSNLRCIGKVNTQHHPNTQLLAMDSELALVPCEHSGEDACYDGMRLFNYRTGEFLRTVSFNNLPNQNAQESEQETYIGPPYLEIEWWRGLVFGGNQSFYILETEPYSAKSGCALHICTPVL